MISGEMRFVRASDELIRKFLALQKQRGGARSPGVFGTLSDSALEQLGQVEDKLFRWVAADQRNANAFAVDPVRVLEQAELSE